MSAMRRLAILCLMPVLVPLIVVLLYLASWIGWERIEPDTVEELGAEQNREIRAAWVHTKEGKPDKVHLRGKGWKETWHWDGRIESK